MKYIVALAMAALPAFCLLLPMQAAAEKADRKEKILINAVDGDADHAKGFYKLEKTVVITQGTLRLPLIAAPRRPRRTITTTLF